MKYAPGRGYLVLNCSQFLKYDPIIPLLVYSNSSKEADIGRAGDFVLQPDGIRAFIPAPLPPDPPIQLSNELIALLSEADRGLARLDGVASVLPNPDFFVAMYVRHEAVLSSQIEGTQSTLEDVLEYELDPAAREPKDVVEVVNYVTALNHGLARLPQLPLSLRLIREIHSKLLEGVRGGTRAPGEFRRMQNWIGPEGASIREAAFVPPPVPEMERALGQLELFLHERGGLPALVHCALAHAQFETIHPFLDGNGRIGRLLITLLLCERGILQRPLLYLSYYLRAHRAEYYDRLTAIRMSGDWEGWIRFFLAGVAGVSTSATDTARAILRLRESLRDELGDSANGVRLLDFAFQQPVLTIRMVEQRLDCAFRTAASLVEQLAARNILREVTGQKRNRIFRFDRFVDLFQPPFVTDTTPRQRNESR